MPAISPPRAVRPRRGVTDATHHARPRRRADQLAAVIHVTHQIAGVLEIEPLLEIIVRQTQELFGYASASVLLSEGDALVYRAIAGASSELLGMRLPLD